jgi:predicted AlkP superfamily phosphohydrolase/phosphomutase
MMASFYEKTDASLGALLKEAPSDALVIVMSDHGTGPRTQRRFNTNAWLASLGILIRSEVRGRLWLSALVRQAKQAVPNKTSLKQWLWQTAPSLRGLLRKSAGGLSSYGRGMDCTRSKAYRMTLHDHVEGVNVNLLGREPQGIVAPADYEEVRDALIREANATVDPATGDNVFQAVFKREELYEGEYADRAPDVILVLKPDFEFGLGSGRQIFSTVSVSRLTRSSATHRPEGILAIAGPKVATEALGDARLIDVPATILWALGLPIPKGVDGRVLTEAFDPELVAEWPIRTGEGEPAHEASSTGAYSSEEEEQLAAHLEDLGYI